MMVSLRRLNELFPALGTGASGRDVDIGDFASALSGELRRLKDRVPKFRAEGFCPQDLLALFPPDRRLAVLDGKAEYRDWRYAAAVRLARPVMGRGSGAPLAVLDGELEKWRSNPLLAEGSGAFAFVRAVFGGEAAEDAEARLGAPPMWRGMTIRNFIAAGSTSQVYRIDHGGRDCVLKLPRVGGEARFRNEVELLRRFDHPHLPKLREWSLDGGAYCVMDYYRTGGTVRRPGCEAALLSALEYVHGSGMVHGDIRLCNLGVDGSGAPVLLDFSHARPSGAPDESAAETEKIKRLLA